MFSSMKSFPGDVYGKRCLTGEKSGDVFNDFCDILHGRPCDSNITWRLDYYSSGAEYASWERAMHEGFYRCTTYEQLEDSTRLALAL